MASIFVVPDNILHKQSCQECFQYLSVGPISLTKQGQVLCGRCHRANEVGGTPSVLNQIIEKSSFKCVNHLNGCKKQLAFHEVEEHEKTCKSKSEECPLCSYKGTLLQIYNHSVHLHSDHIINTGIFTFSLAEDEFKKSMLYIYKDVLFVINAEMDTSTFKVYIERLDQSISPATQQFEVNIWKERDGLNRSLEVKEFAWFDHTTYSLMANRNELEDCFGQEAKLFCQLVIGHVTFTVKEMAVERKFHQLRKEKQEVSRMFDELREQEETYSHIIDVFKNVGLFSCLSCKAYSGVKIYFCPKMHGYCEECVKPACKFCGVHTTFKRQEQLEKCRIKCGWNNCNQQIFFIDYLKHQASCPFRPYKCPLKSCQKILYSKNKFIKHWHATVPKLFLEEELYCERDEIVDYYWIVGKDVYCLSVEWKDDQLKVLIQEINVIMSKVSFECTVKYERADHLFWQKVNFNSFLCSLQMNIKTGAQRIQNRSYRIEQIRIQII